MYHFFHFQNGVSKFRKLSFLQNQISKNCHKKQRIFCPIFSFLLFWGPFRGTHFICDFISEFWPEETIIVKSSYSWSLPNDLCKLFCPQIGSYSRNTAKNYYIGFLGSFKISLLLTDFFSLVDKLIVYTNFKVNTEYITPHLKNIYSEFQFEALNIISSSLKKRTSTQQKLFLKRTHKYIYK